jgi:hypothetical protein
MRRRAHWLTLISAIVALGITAGIVRLVIVGQTAPPSPTQHQAHELAHYWAHLVAGRALQVCPCTRRRAYWQYWKAHFHAGTPQQRALVTTAVPHSGQAGLRDVVVVSWLGTRTLLGNPLTLQTIAGVLLLSGPLMLWRLRRTGPSP